MSVIAQKLKTIKFMKVFSMISVMMILIPSLIIFISVLNKSNENWQHIKTYMLESYFVNTVIILFFTGLLTAVIGTSLAFIITVYDFPMKKFLKWGLMLPLTIPAYIGAYTYYGLLNYTGVIQSTLRNGFDIRVDQSYFDVMSIQGVVFVFTMFLFPYVYTTTRAYLSRQTATLIENSRILGHGQLSIFFKVVLPISRGAIIGGVTLVLLEVLNDFGVVSYYGVSTFSTAIFKTWFSMGDIDSAIRLAGILMAIVFCLVVTEKLLRGRRKYSMTTTKQKPLNPIKLEGIKKYLATGYSVLVFALSFLIPFMQLLHWNILSIDRFFDLKLIGMTLSSLGVAVVSSVIIIVIALIVANNNRIYESIVSKLYSKTIVLGYSIPGAVIAIGVIAMFIGLDRYLKPLYLQMGISKTLVLSTSIIMLIFAYVIRFLAIGYSNIEAGTDKIGKKYYEASIILGKSKLKTFMEVDLPMLKPSIISGFILVFIDTIKELPLTLILRPFNFNTLATKAYEYANDEMIHEASVPSVLIILISMVLIYIMRKISTRKEKG